MTLNDLERRNSPYFAFFSRNSTDFQADYSSECEWRSDESVTETQKRFNTEMTSGHHHHSLLLCAT